MNPHYLLYNWIAVLAVWKSFNIDKWYDYLSYLNIDTCVNVFCLNIGRWCDCFKNATNTSTKGLIMMAKLVRCEH